jgi:hypothetical protein
VSDVAKKWAISAVALLMAALAGALSVELLRDPEWGGFLRNFVTLYQAGLGVSFAVIGVSAFIGAFAVWVPDTKEGGRQ